ncbi:Collagen type IV alpha-3-binding protein [Trichinella spiralis]|uniref:Collagen type IV alpha-3-binding protein n=1 Tax=Trichinella spiralis TaxID=6334 RepID=A0A0V1BHH8_TRISP|nr:Collagen type IV alpha-3-binding protein [Trichinella spiralis]
MCSKMNDQTSKLGNNDDEDSGHNVKKFLTQDDPLYGEVNTVTQEIYNNVVEQAEQCQSEDNQWKLFYEQKDVRFYSREMECKDVVTDPVIAKFSIPGVTAMECAQCFFNPQCKRIWDRHLDSLDVLEHPADDTFMLYQLQKRFWPAKQRDSLFWVHLRRLPNKDPKTSSTVLVTFNSSTHSKAPPANAGNLVRSQFSGCMLCHTIQVSDDKLKTQSQITREDVRCEAVYTNQVNPGGWFPKRILRGLYKQQYPQFIKAFIKFTLDHAKNKSIEF